MLPVAKNRLTPASLSKQEESQLKKRRLTGKYGNSLCSGIRISNPASRCYRLASKSFGAHRAAADTSR